MQTEQSNTVVLHDSLPSDAAQSRPLEVGSTVLSLERRLAEVERELMDLRQSRLVNAEHSALSPTRMLGQELFPPMVDLNDTASAAARKHFDSRQLASPRREKRFEPGEIVVIEEPSQQLYLDDAL